jgi:hypothetical protein
MAMNDGVEKIDKITKVVKEVPQKSHFLVDLPKYCTSHDENNVIEHCDGDNCEPLKERKIL